MRKIISIQGSWYLCNDGTIWDYQPTYAEKQNPYDSPPEFKWKQVILQPIPQDGYVDNVANKLQERFGFTSQYQDQDQVDSARRNLSAEIDNMIVTKPKEEFKLEVGKVYENSLSERYLVISKQINHNTPRMFICISIDENSTLLRASENGWFSSFCRHNKDLIRLSDDQSHEFILSGEK